MDPNLPRQRSLLDFEFLGLCLVAALAFCNITVFYNLYDYLLALGIPGELGGVVIGSYNLTAMLLFLLVSPFLTAANAPRTMLIGIAILVVAGFGYLWADSFQGLIALRIFNGLGQFLLGAGTMSLFVGVIPPDRSGQAFGIYSVAILFSYGLVPTTMEWVNRLLPSPAHGYALATVSLLPATLVVLKIKGRLAAPGRVRPADLHLPTAAELKRNLTSLPVATLLFLNLCYFLVWSSLFFLFKGFAAEQGVGNVGSFFIFQTGMMIVLRLLAGRLFDLVAKEWLVAGAFTLVALGFLWLDHLPGPWAVPLAGILFGTGLGGGYPVINGLMFDVSEPRFRALTANLMMFTVQAGFVFGPSIGGALVARNGYHGYFLACAGLVLTAAGCSALLGRRRRSSGRAVPEPAG